MKSKNNKDFPTDDDIKAADEWLLPGSKNSSNEGVRAALNNKGATDV